MKRLLLAAAVFLPLASGADPVFDRASTKLRAIDSGSVKPGSIVTFTPEELNAWARVRVPELTDGIRNPRLLLGAGTATAYALVDFVKIRQAEGQSTNPIFARMIEGERPVKISVRLESGGGQCTVYLTSVELSGVEATGAVLDFLVNAFFLPLFPEARINRPFELANPVERIDVRPDAARISIRK